MPRVFAAIEIPEDIGTALAKLRQPLPGARWQQPAEFHLTLRYAGDIEARYANEFADALDRLSADAFELRLAGLGAFGGNDPRVIYAGTERSEPLEQLARACERAARDAGLQPETRQFKPHVTLARLNGTPPELVARALQRLGAFRSEAFFVPRFVLMSSRPNVGGGPYVVEAAFPLQGGYGGDLDEE